MPTFLEKQTKSALPDSFHVVHGIIEISVTQAFTNRSTPVTSGCFKYPAACLSNMRELNKLSSQIK